MCGHLAAPRHLLLLLLGRVTMSDAPRPPPQPNPWHAGWGFNKHGGFPKLPAAWSNDTRLSSSVVSYFLGNSTGMNSPEELAAEARFGIVGVRNAASNLTALVSRRLLLGCDPFQFLAISGIILSGCLSVIIYTGGLAVEPGAPAAPRAVPTQPTIKINNDLLSHVRSMMNILAHLLIHLAGVGTRFRPQRRSRLCGRTSR